MNEIKHDLIVLGTGIAGLRAAVEASIASNGSIDIGIISKLQLMRSHSVSAEGGTAAVLRSEEGDSAEIHAWDTVKGSDFLGDQDVAFRFVETVPSEIFQLDRWGLPWSRRSDGRIDQRPFGGHSFDRACFAADKTGFFEMQTLYDTLLKFGNFKRYDEFFVTSIIIQNGRFAGLTAIRMATGEMFIIRCKTLIIATGGQGRLFGFTTYAHTVTGDGLAMAYRAGLPIKDTEFIQFHPTGLIPSGILMTEACRGEGGYLLNNKGERFMDKYAPTKRELAPRDIVSRSSMTEIESGRGFDNPDGLHYVHLDLRHLGENKINERLGFIRELSIKFAGIDPVLEPIPVRPVAHYSMGGIHTDINGATAVPGIMAAGEAACVSLHGANRLGANSTAECLVWGKITGAEAAKFVSKEKTLADIDQKRFKAEEDRIFNFLMQKNGNETVFRIRQDLKRTMDMNMGVFRTGDGMSKALNDIKELKERFKNIKINDKSRTFNTELITVLESEFLLDIAEVAVLGALQRKESRGGHARRDFQTRDDANFLKHTMATYSSEGPKLSYIPVNITAWQPVERKY